jgi:hypothetical protein
MTRFLTGEDGEKIAFISVFIIFSFGMMECGICDWSKLWSLLVGMT